MLTQREVYGPFVRCYVPSMGLVAKATRLHRGCRVAALRYGVSRRAVIARLLDVHRRTGMRPAEALAIGLGDPRLPSAVIESCIGKEELLELQGSLNPTALACTTADKSIFYPLCEGLGVPVPRVFAVIGRGVGWVRGGAPVAGRAAWARTFAAILPDAFVSKPASTFYGDGVRVWRRAADAFIDAGGRRLSPEGLHDALSHDPRYERFVIQARVTNHPEVTRLSGSPFLQTVRATTLVDGRGEVHILHTLLKIIVGDNVIDNFHHGTTGNLMANVDIETGILSPAMTWMPDHVGIVIVGAHPETKIELAAVALPHWRELLGLVRRCARLFARVRTIGWDVALTPTGPVIIEGNRIWDPFDIMPERAAPTAPFDIGPTLTAETLGRLAGVAALLRREAGRSRGGALQSAPCGP